MTLTALELLERDGIHTLRSKHLPDEKRALLSNMFLRLALSDRVAPASRVNSMVEQYLDTANRMAREIDDPVLRRNMLTQVKREQGTWLQTRGRLEEAREAFRDSRDQAKPLPSQRYHVYQARIKEAQTLLARGRLKQAGRILDDLRVEFETESMGGFKLAWQVYPHFLRTEIWHHIVSGRFEEAQRALNIHRRTATERGLQGELRQNERLQTLLRFSRVLPSPLRPGFFAWTIRAGRGSVSRWVLSRLGR